jgi:hypothetical protein
MNTFGISRLIDSNDRVFNMGNPVYYVINNFVTVTSNEIGLPITGAGGTGGGGTQDILIDPPPEISTVSANYIASVMQAGVTLRMGSLVFTVSDTWVKAEMTARGFSNPQQVFEDSTVQGFRYLGTLYNMDRATPNAGIGNILNWTVIANAPGQ